MGTRARSQPTCARDVRLRRVLRAHASRRTGGGGGQCDGAHACWFDSRCARCAWEAGAAHAAARTDADRGGCA
eukprot:5714031-Pleurochrysis_carterae.AAC.1